VKGLRTLMDLSHFPSRDPHGIFKRRFKRRIQTENSNREFSGFLVGPTLYNSQGRKCFMVINIVGMNEVKCLYCKTV
jgi:hypothetical protein